MRAVSSSTQVIGMRTFIRTLLALALSSQLVSRSAAAADGGTWVLLPPRVPAQLGDKTATALLDAAIEELFAQKQQLVPRDKLDKSLQAMGVSATQINPEDLADVTGGVAAAHAVLIIVDKAGSNFSYRLVHYDARRKDSVVREGEARRLALLRMIRETLAEVITQAMSAAPTKGTGKEPTTKTPTKETIKEATKEPTKEAAKEPAKEAPKDPAKDPNKPASPAPATDAVDSASLGVGMSALNEEKKRSLGLKDEGVLIARVKDKGPGQAAGIKEGDVLLTIAGQVIDRPEKVATVLKSVDPTEPISVVVWRAKKKQSLEVHIDEAAAAAPSTSKPGATKTPTAEAAPASDPGKRRKLGTKLKAVTEAMKEDMLLPRTQGAYVVEVTPGGAAAQANILPDDVILAFEGTEVKDPADLIKRSAEADASRMLPITIFRDGEIKMLKIWLGVGDPPARP